MKYFLLTILLISTKVIIAQENRINISFGGGVALPKGDFKETSGSHAGFAENGILGRMGLGIPLSNVVQLDFDLSRASYKVDEETYSSIFRSSLEQQLPGSSKNSSVTIGKYANTNAFASFRLNLTRDRSQLYIKTGFGASWFSVPTVTAFAKVGPNSITSTASYETAISLMLNLSAGLQVELSDNVSLDLNFQYLKSEFDSDVSVFTEDQNGNSVYTSTTEYPRFSSINLTIGFVFFINPKEKEE